MNAFPSDPRGFLTTLSPQGHSRNDLLFKSLLGVRDPFSVSPTVSCSATATSPPDHLLSFIRRRHWEAALERILQHPLDARLLNTPNKATPLHAALMHRAPHAIIAVLIDAFPAALFLQDTEGWTPLHVNILYGSHEDTTLLLIQRGGPLAASLHSKFVGAPLHLLCRHGPQSIKTLQALVETRPDQVTATNEAGVSAPNLLYKSFLRRHDLHDRQNVEDLVAQLVVMVKAVYIDRNEATANQNSAGPSLHQIVLFQYNYARETDLVRLVLLVHPHLAQERDSFGRLGIHIAAALPRITHAPLSSYFHVHVPQDALLVLLTHDLTAAAEPDPVTGRLPLFTALEEARNRSFGTGCIDALVQAHPSALQLRDPVTGLYAYQLAALAADNNDDE
jgi:ankyrin repeat protein